jgi:hypothetical protein
MTVWRASAALPVSLLMREQTHLKARLVPLYFESDQDPDFANQLAALQRLLTDEARSCPAAFGALPRPTPWYFLRCLVKPIDAADFRSIDCRSW